MYPASTLITMPVNTEKTATTREQVTSRIAIVTGAGGVLGRAFSTALAQNGWTVAALGRTSASLDATVAACASVSAGSKSHSPHHPHHPHCAFPCDVTDEKSVSQAFRAVTDRYGQLNLLVNNAGVPGPTGRLDSIDATAFEGVLRTNALGTFLCTREAFSWMSSHGGGRIINNGSIAAHAPRSHTAAYAASKAAVASLTISTALDGRECGITATELDIGNAQSGLLETFNTAEPVFDAAEAAHMLVAIASLPCGVSVDSLTVTATGMPYLGRG